MSANNPIILSDDDAGKNKKNRKNKSRNSRSKNNISSPGNPDNTNISITINNNNSNENDTNDSIPPPDILREVITPDKYTRDGDYRVKRIDRIPRIPQHNPYLFRPKSSKVQPTNHPSNNDNNNNNSNDNNNSITNIVTPVRQYRPKPPPFSHPKPQDYAKDPQGNKKLKNTERPKYGPDNYGAKLLIHEWKSKNDEIKTALARDTKSPIDAFEEEQRKLSDKIVKYKKNLRLSSEEMQKNLGYIQEDLNKIVKHIWKFQDNVGKAIKNTPKYSDLQQRNHKFANVECRRLAQIDSLKAEVHELKAQLKDQKKTTHNIKVLNGKNITDAEELRRINATIIAELKTEQQQRKKLARKVVRLEDQSHEIRALTRENQSLRDTLAKKCRKRCK